MPSAPRAGEHRRRVLVVDDEPVFTQLMQDVLAGLPERVDVSTAANGQAAVEAVRRQAPDLVMLDINMPEMNGLDALKHIRALHPGLPVLMITGGDNRSASEALANGAFGYLPKPMDIRYLGHMVQLALDSRPVER
jgi:DNA-binding NtrC family response regulator